MNHINFRRISSLANKKRWAKNLSTLSTLCSTATSKKKKIIGLWCNFIVACQKRKRKRHNKSDGLRIIARKITPLTLRRSFTPHWYLNDKRRINFSWLFITQGLFWWCKGLCISRFLRVNIWGSIRLPDNISPSLY